MTINRKDLDRQINVFLALRGHDYQMVDWCFDGSFMEQQLVQFINQP